MPKATAMTPINAVAALAGGSPGVTASGFLPAPDELPSAGRTAL